MAHFPLKDLRMLHRRKGLHLCERDSTVWFHFCLFKFFMLWWNCAYSSCIRGSEEEEEGMVSLSITSPLVMSLRYHVRDVVFCGGVQDFAEVFRILQRCLGFCGCA